MDLFQESHSFLPLWVKIFNIPLEGWNENDISFVARALGRPIYANPMTQDRSWLGFACVCGLKWMCTLPFQSL